MGRFVWIAFGLIVIQNHAFPQVTERNLSAGDISNPAPDSTTSTVVQSTAIPPEYSPMTASERARRYLQGAFGPEAILRAAAAGGISQWTKTPKEWGVGPEAYGDRFGSAFARHVIRESFEYAASAALHEDNRYFRSTESGVFKRTKHAMASVFVARNAAGGEHFAYSRFGSVLGSSFISRLWEPRSNNTAGDAAVTFGVNMAADVGWNVFKEFCPRSLGKHLRIP